MGPYTWEPHETKTADGWHLTIFRITGREGKPTDENPENEGKLPVMFQHDGAVSYVSGDALPVQLVDLGYDVWMGNNRGMKYSNVHDRDGEWSLAERWDFNWATMGEYDLPAMISKVIEVSEKPKTTIITFSSGAPQCIYSMVKD